MPGLTAKKNGLKCLQTVEIFDIRAVVQILLDLLIDSHVTFVRLVRFEGSHQAGGGITWDHILIVS